MATRQWAADGVTRRLGTVLTAAAMTADDLADPIDDALRMMGYSEDELATAEPTDGFAFLTLVIYTTLKAVRVKLSMRFDLSTEGTSLRLQQTLASVERMLAAAETDVIRIFGTVPTGAVADESPFVEIDLNYLTPAAATVVEPFPPYVVLGTDIG